MTSIELALQNKVIELDFENKKIKKALKQCLCFLEEQEIDCECDTCLSVKTCIKIARKALN